MSRNASILITGTHRSGTTWVGKMLARHKKLVYIQEPFNPSTPRSAMGYSISNYYQYINALPKNEIEEIEQALKKMLQFRYYGVAKNYKMHYALRVAIKKWMQNYNNRKKSLTPLIKDPLALLSADYLYHKFQCKPICMIRHPLGFCSSLKKAGWYFPFDRLTRQNNLIIDCCPQFEKEIHEFSANSQKTIIQHGILLWNILHSRILEYKNKYPDWFFQRYEELLVSPDEGFKELFKFCNLDFDFGQSEAIITSLSSDAKEPNNEGYQPRNRHSLFDSWRKRLTPEESRIIMNDTLEIRRKFYSEEDEREFCFC